MNFSRALIAALALAAVTAPAFADALTLRSRVEASGASITLGDVFDGAGAAASRPIAPAPSAGQTAMLPAAFLVEAAQSAGYQWAPPTGVSQVRVIRPGGARATLPASSTQSPGVQATDVAVRRGEVIELTYVSPGLALSARARALGNGGVGETIRLVNLQSNRTVEATVTGPGAAAVNGN
jgi:flagella basal body P-ring formation protein FlgA